MAKTKVAVSLDAKLVRDVDRLVRSRHFANRSAAIETALTEKLVRLDRIRLARECARLDPRHERALAEEGLPADLAAWPEY
jgi:metal-responsive CopG/Arc/MetJ family transcriptional regulator